MGQGDEGAQPNGSYDKITSEVGGQVRGKVSEPVSQPEVSYRRMRPRVPMRSGYGGASAVLAVCGNGPTRAVWGTAFMVGPWIALTANHVIEEYEATGRVPSESMVLLAPKGGELQIWGVHQIVKYPDAEIAIILVEQRFTPTSILEVDFLEITTRCPLPGEAVGTLGYVAAAASFDTTAGIHVDYEVSTGLAGKFYPKRGSMSPGPSFSTNLAVRGGMSGSPVFNADGRVAALVGTSMPPDGDHNQHTTFGQLLWQVLLEEVTPVWPIGHHKRPVRLLSLVHEPGRLERTPEGIAYRW